MAGTTIPQPITSGSDQAGGGSPASTNIPPAPDAQNDAVKQSIVDAYPNSGPNVSNPNPAMPTLAPQASAAAPTQANAAPILQHAPATPAASLHARLFDGVLKTLSGGPVKVLQSDPTTGETRQVEVPQSKSTMANAVLAGVLSSMFTGAQGRGAEPDYKPVMGSHGTQHAEEQAKQQALSDQMQDRKMKVVKNNLETVTSQLAAARMGDEAMDKQINDGQSMIALSKAYDENKEKGDPLSIQKENLSKEEAMQMIGQPGMGLIAVPSGRTSHLDPTTGKPVNDITYTVLNPNVNVKLGEDDVKMMAAVNPSWADAYSRSGGNVTVPLNVVNAERLVRNKVNNVQAFVNQLANDPDTAKAIGLTGKPGNLMDIAQDKTLREAITNTQTQMAAHAGSDRHYSILDAMLTTPGGPALAQKLGIDPAKANAWLDEQHNERLSAEKLASMGGIGDKAPAPEEDKSAVTQTINSDPTLTDPQKKILLAGVSGTMTNGQLKDLKKQAEGFNKANQSDATRNKLSGGDPAVAAQTATNVLDGNLASVEKLASMRGDARQVLNNAIVAEAQKRGLDPNNWSQAALDTKVAMWNDYRSNDKNKTGSNIGAFRTFLNHADEAETISGEWKRLGSPILDKPMGELEKTGFGGTQFANFERSLEPVRKEYMSFLNSNRAEHDADIKVMQTVLNSSSTPRQVSEALSYLATSADRRLAEIARTYNNAMGTTLPTILSPQAKDVLKRFNVKSMTEPLTADLPKGQGQKIDPQHALIFRDAAGGDMTRGREMAKQAGWTL